MKQFHFQTLSSTMDMANVLYQRVTPQPFCVHADEQTHGIGRQGRLWHSLKGNLHVTYVLSLPPWIKTYYLPFMFSSLLATIFSQKCQSHREDHSPISLKWPNDILLHGKKVAGLLIQLLNPDTNTISLGIGVNLCRAPDVLATPSLFPPTSFHEWGYSLSKEELLNGLSKEIEEHLRQLRTIHHDIEKQDFWESTRHTWLTHCHHKNSMIHINDPHPPHDLLTGRFVTVDENGHLIMELDASNDAPSMRKSFATGDVFF